MHKLMCRFVATMKGKKEKIPDPKIDMACPAGIPCNKRCEIGGPIDDSYI